MLSVDILQTLFTLKPGKSYLMKRESNTLEFKQSFHFNSIAEYVKDFVAFANNYGGYIVFGVMDRPHIPIGLNNNHFKDTDEARITEFVNQHFAPGINWVKDIYTWNGNDYGIIYIYESTNKPIISINHGGRNNEIKSGEIYFRYVGRTEKIRHAELSRIIDEKIRLESNRWRELFEKISKIGPQNAAILDTLEGKIEEGNRTILIDDEMIEQLKFIREGQFHEKEGAITLKLIGEVHPVSVVGLKASVLHDNPYIFRAKDVAEHVAKAISQPLRAQPEHLKCWKYYRIRGTYSEGKSQCKSKYCDFLENLRVFMYTQDWIDFLIEELSDPKKYRQIMFDVK